MLSLVKIGMVTINNICLLCLWICSKIGCHKMCNVESLYVQYLEIEKSLTKWLYILSGGGWLSDIVIKIKIYSENLIF